MELEKRIGVFAHTHHYGADRKVCIHNILFFLDKTCSMDDRLLQQITIDTCIH